ncbi:MAG: AraC family transcriptional regulator [Lachnospiraceae bacterium]|nr:AraC family transcriptional regulator [Lachnospiraceae bacterium]
MSKITNETINHAIDYILQHINEELSVDDVAAHCHFSKYYFSRMFKEATGESVYAFIRRLKLEQSAFRLKVEPERTVTDIGCEFGYSPSNYSWMFRQRYRTNPVNFRRNVGQATIRHAFMHMDAAGRQTEELALSDLQRGDGQDPNAYGCLETFEECNRKIVIKNLPDYFVLYERRIGSYHNLSGQWGEFMAKYQEYVTADTQFLERTFDDPVITDTDGCLYDICMSVDRSVSLENTCTIEGGKCAVYPYKGLGKHIYAAYQTIFTVWLPHTPYELDYRSGFDIYHLVDNESGYMELDICMPLKDL